MEERTLSSTHPWTGRYIRVRIDEIVRSDGHRTTREVVEHPGAVAMLAWDGERLAMVRQWRHATGQVLLEIPAGTLEPGELPAVTARRELAEEVGLAATTWVEGPRFFTAPGFCTELMHLYLATGLKGHRRGRCRRAARTVLALPAGRPRCRRRRPDRRCQVDRRYRLVGSAPRLLKSLARRITPRRRRRAGPAPAGTHRSPA